MFNYLNTFFKKTFQWLDASDNQTSPTNASLAEQLRVSADLIESSPNQKELIESIMFSFRTIGELSYYNGITVSDLVTYANKAVESNWTIYCKDEGEASETERRYEEGTHPLRLGTKIDCYYVEGNGQWIVKRDDDDTFLPSLNYKPLYLFK